MFLNYNCWIKLINIIQPVSKIYKKAMVVNLGILLIAILIACKAISIFSKKFNNSKAFTNFVNYGTTDRVNNYIYIYRFLG